MAAQNWGCNSRFQQASAITDEDILQTVKQAADSMFEAKVQLAGAEQFTQFLNAWCCCRALTHWRDHLSALDYLRQGIHLRGYAQKQPSRNTSARPLNSLDNSLDSVKNEVTRSRDGQRSSPMNN